MDKKLTKQIKEIEQEENRLKEIRKQWYSLEFIRFALVEQCKGRELCFLTKYPRLLHYGDKISSAVRYLQCGHTKFLGMHFDAFNVLTKPYMMLYASTAYLDSLPTFSYNMKERTKTDEYRQFGNDYMNHVIGYDIFFDIDNLDIEEAWKDASELKDMFDENKIPYSIKFSGSKGFHFIIPFKYVGWKITDFNKFISDVANFIYNIKVIYQIDSIDASITDAKRVCKLAYSLDRDKVVMPLGDGQFKNFSIETVQWRNVLRTVKLMNRGNLLRTHELPDSELKENLEKFFKGHL